jgi:hypothetical protein
MGMGWNAEATSENWDAVKTTSDLTTLHKLVVLPQANCSVDRRNQILLTNQLPSETTSQLPLVMDGP